jgi:hypothetical protein
MAWLSAWQEELPLKPPIPFLENYSNGEFFHEQTPRDLARKNQFEGKPGCAVSGG